MIRPMEARDKGPALGLIWATGFFPEAEVGVAAAPSERGRGTRQFSIDLPYKEVARVPDFRRAGDDSVIYAKYFR